MNTHELTCRVRSETVHPVERGGAARKVGRRALGAAWAVLLGGAVLSGCVSVNAPDKPIVIELNINIKQEVVYRLAADAGNTIQKNPGVF